MRRTRRAGAILLGAGVVLAALVFGSRPLGVAGIGLVLAALAARAWAGFVRGPAAVTHVPEPSPATEGDRVRVRIHARRGSRIPIASAVVRGRLGRLGPYECRLSGLGRTATGVLDLGRIPRGRFCFSEVALVLGDHLGLESVSLPVAEDGAIVVHPRLVELDALFSDAGRQRGDGRRLLLRRPVGFDFHSVREYEQGESLRRVHWPTTAKRGQLMVKELEDAPRDAVVVLLDCDPSGAAGEPPDSSFDTAVRVAGSLLRAYALRGRRTTLLTTGRDGSAVTVGALEGDFRAALDALAAAEPDALQGLVQTLARGRSPVTRAGELVVVTASLEPRAVEGLVSTAGRRLVSVVWIDAPSYAGRPTRAAPAVLRLSTAGIQTAVVRQGDDLAAALAGFPARELAHG